MQKKNDFIITRGTLLAYAGNGPIVRVPAGVTSIGRLAFADNDGPEEVLLPNGLRRIGEGAFRNCRSLRAVSLPESLRSIGEAAFSGCVSLRDIRLPAELDELGASAFWGCRSLKELSLPGSLREIGTFAFAGCDALKRIRADGGAYRLRSDVFGRGIPASLYKALGALWPRMTDGALKQYVLTERGWASLSEADRVELFLSRHGKALLSHYRAVVSGSETERLGAALLERAPQLGAAGARGVLSAYLELSGERIDAELASRIAGAMGQPKQRRVKKAAPYAAPAGVVLLLKEERSGALCKRIVARDGLISTN